MKLLIYSLLIAFLLAMPSLAYEAKTIIGKGHNYYITSCDTDSMYPTMGCHDNLTAVYVENKYNLSVGDVIMFYVPPEVRQKSKMYFPNGTIYVLHRIVGVYRESLIKCNEWACLTYRNDYYITKGDNNGYIDDWVVRPYHVKHRIIAVNGKDVKPYAAN